ncbi:MULTISPECIES: mannose-1-phosphate guanylyltransferase/mannose-6-phosphate isomerase [unclassified Sphingobium]|uniref:mannose-1-phosphate guanylyltransferase/mannose-6-phosphate isomerase n=1 Tax=unclassified Sphingobium TaxID=2611147 RepID=UPI000D17139F|nr:MULTISPECIES: mannose-1-phosphate guanylyltransferase/mannose-6-phosphate isomerase [unclassified Sphingobium]PSO09739.1 mannose-1-phosphate guanylyltransferase/mannose-6-phosphate isomerase [Sphingobium sp. AEW4]TWD19065.1 mannose-1-phosphate guanylyltransferase/mannose-1-phosphate guanylyltransferase/mannose-6-phosphate isomerase [Sphingobium sp. AEW013]
MTNDPMTIVPVILSGGSGTRLWPMSRPERPKQLLPLTAPETMLQLTAVRTQGLDTARVVHPILVANAAHADMIDAQMRESSVADYKLMLEPVGRNTAPAIALAALEAQGNEALLVMPSDHVIADLPAFHDAITRALPLVSQGWLVTFGITPDGPETGYGYIQMGKVCGANVHEVVRFVEKPDLANAQRMLAQGDHSWNAGIFLFRADAYLAALQRHQPLMLDMVRQAMAQARREGGRIFPDTALFSQCPANSVDYAIMERETQVACVPVSMGWSDVGSWDSLHAVSERDESDNAVRGDALLLDARGCLVHSDGPRVTMVDVDDLIVVVAQGDVMILKRGESQKVRKVTEALKALDAAKVAS